MKNVSNEKDHMKLSKRKSYDSYGNHMKKDYTNGLSAKERDYMIDKTMQKLGIIPKFRPAVAKAANYISGPRYWEIFDFAEKANSPARYFIKAINREMYSER